jgi:hypothetical protein
VLILVHRDLHCVRQDYVMTITNVTSADLVFLARENTRHQ